MSTGKKIGQGLVTVGLIGAPAFIGQVVSELARKHVPEADKAPEAVLDAVGCTLVAALELGVIYAASGKAKAAQSVPFALAGAVLGAAMPLFNEFVKDAIKSTDASAVAALGSANVVPLQLKQPAGTDLYAGIGGAAPGGARAAQKTGGAI